MRTAADHTAGISSLFTHSNNGKHESQCGSRIRHFFLVWNACLSLKLDREQRSCSSSQATHPSVKTVPRLCSVSKRPLTLRPHSLYTNSPFCSDHILSFSLPLCIQAQRRRTRQRTHIHTLSARARAHSCKCIDTRQRAPSTQSSPVC